MILTDDHGYGDVSAYLPGPDLSTPNTDQLAKEGMLSTTMRANCTVCSPMLAAILKGLYADRVGVPGVIRTNPAFSWGYFDPAVPTLADHLRGAGYLTAIVGKWHLGLASAAIGSPVAASVISSRNLGPGAEAPRENEWVRTVGSCARPIIETAKSPKSIANVPVMASERLAGTFRRHLVRKRSMNPLPRSVDRPAAASLLVCLEQRRQPCHHLGVLLPNIACL